MCQMHVHEHTLFGDDKSEHSGAAEDVSQSVHHCPAVLAVPLPEDHSTLLSER